MHKFEYMSQSYQLVKGRGGNEVGTEMGELGSKGWELVSVIPWGDTHCLAFFKRPF